MAFPSNVRLFGALILICATACDLSSKPGGSDGGVRSDRPPEVAATLELGQQGGVIAILDADSELFGANVVVPPDVLAHPTELTVQAAEALPEGSNAIGAGTALQILPEGISFARPVTVEIPVPAGLSPEGLTAGWWDPEERTWVPGADVEMRFVDPGAELGAFVVFTTTHTGTFRLLYQEPQPVAVLNDGSGAIEMWLGSQHFATAASRGYTPPSPGQGELTASLAMREVIELLLVPGEYILQATFEGERVPRCERVTITDPVSSTEPLEVSFSDFTPPCPLPAVRITATPRDAAIDGAVELQAVATGSPGTMLTWHWLLTGGALATEATGTVRSGEMVTSTWDAPAQPGVYHLSFVAVTSDGWFGEAHTTVRVTTRNQRPQFSSFTASPEIIGPGFPEGARAVAEQGSPGVTRLRTVVSDLDGDDVSLFWIYRQPGDFFDAESGAKLARDEETGLVVWPETGEPYAEAQLLFMAPSAGYVDALPRGLWMPATIGASDGELTSRAWRMVGIGSESAPPPPADGGPQPDAAGMDGGPGTDSGPRDAGVDAGPDASMPAVVGRCLSVADSECEMYVGSSYASEAPSLEESCSDLGRTWTSEFACPESGAIGACYRFPGEPREVATVHYGSSPTAGEIEMLRNECTMLSVGEGGPGTWQRPYRAP